MRIALAALLVLLLTGDALASKSCPTRAEAKKMYNGAYLYWYRDAGGNRCWTNRRRSKSESARGRFTPRHRERVEVASQPVAPTPTPPPAITYLPADLMPQPQQPREYNILDNPRWAWVHEARAAAHDADKQQFSPLQESRDPDVWPVLPKNEPTPPQTSMAALFATLMAGVLFGALLGRLHYYGKLRITR